MKIFVVWFVMLGIVGVVTAAAWLCRRIERNYPSEKFDERQKTVRANAYRFAFWVGVICSLVIMCLQAFFEDSLPVAGYLLVAAGAALQILAFNAYCLLNGAALPLGGRGYSSVVAHLLCGGVWLIAAYLNSLTWGALKQNGSIASLMLIVSALNVSLGVMNFVGILMEKKKYHE